MSPEVEDQALVRAVLESKEDGRLVLTVPHTEYRLQLVPTVPVGEVDVEVGKRITGTIHARALRMHRARGGGRFIEPVWGEPRIVAGKVISVDEARRRVLVDVSVPMWVEAPDGQDFDIVRPGELLNFYVESGASFRPVIPLG